MIRVAMEARRLHDRPIGGVGRAIANILPPLRELVDVTAIVDDRLGPVWRDLDATRVSAPRGVPGSLWINGPVRSWVNRNEPDLFHGTFNATAVGLKCPSVATIHDLSFEVHHEGFTWARRRVFRIQARYAARHCRIVIAPSQFSADQIGEVYRVPVDRLAVLPHALDPVFSPDRAAEAPALAQRLGIDGPYVVAVGVAPRRGLDVALDAWQLVRARGVDVTLVLLGSGPPPLPGVVVAGGLGDTEWSALLAGAEALLYPTRYEGFGLPALEAAGSGTPVVCARIGPLPEVLGDAAEWCPEPTAEAIAPALERVLTDRARAAELRDAGLAHIAAGPTWADLAAQQAAIYERALG